MTADKATAVPEGRSGGRRGWPRRAGAGAAGGQEAPQRIAKDTLDCAEKIFGVDFTEAEEEAGARAA